LTDDPGAGSRRAAAAKARAAQARLEAVEAALAEIPVIEERHAAQVKKHHTPPKAKEVRASTTDAECRVMKMADGGFRPAFNVQLATDVDGGCIVGVDVTNNGTDQPHVAPMLDDIERRTGKLPRDYLVDGGFVGLENIDTISERCGRPYAPVPKPKSPEVERYAPKPGDSPMIAAWRRRMGTESAKRIYVKRGSTAERTNADLRVHRGLDRLNVRGLAKVKCVVLLAAITFNLLRMISESVHI
jgi:hypothetical protein